MSGGDWGPSGFERLVGLMQQADYEFLRFDAVDTAGERPRALLRHDVDASLLLAHELAQREAAHGIVATYFCLVQSDLYPVTTRTGRSLIREIRDMGHQIGLHFDPGPYDNDPARALLGLVAEQEMLSLIAGEEVKAMSQHNPSIAGRMELESSLMIDAYSSVLSDKFKYLSDSCMAWREDPDDWIQARSDIQLLLHPLYWTVDGDAEACFSAAERGALEALRGHFKEAISLNRKALASR